MFKKHKNTNPRYSLRAWARDLNLKDAASLSAVLNRKRPLSKSLADQIRNGLKLSERECVYFDLLHHCQLAKGDQESNFFADLIRTFKSQYETVALSLENFEVIACWYHLVILELARLPGFDLNTENICKRLNSKLDALTVERALKRLVQTNLLVRDAKGILCRAEPIQHVVTETPSSAIVSHHQGMIRQALIAIEQQDINRRDFSGFQTVTCRAKIPEAKRRITQFRKELMAFLDDPNGDTIYQLNIQLFDHLN